MDIENVEITMRELRAINDAISVVQHCQGRTLFEKLYLMGGSFEFHTHERRSYVRSDEESKVPYTYTLTGRIYIKTDNKGYQSIAINFPRRKGRGE